MRQFCILICLMISCCMVYAQQDTVHLNLQQVVRMAKAQSIAAKQAATLKENKYWLYKTYQSNYKPQLSLNGALPAYTKSYTQVVQPNGSINFQSVHYNNSSLDLSLSQAIASTGGTIFATSQMQRFDDFDRSSILYNGVPYAIGYTQPLFRFNQMAWDKKIEPLKYDESKQAYIESMEQVAIKSNGYFFDLLLAQVNLQIAETNLGNTGNILRIAHEKLDMGKISRNEILQLELEQLKAEKSVGVSKRELEVASLNLKSYVGMQQQGKIVLDIPHDTIHMEVSTDKVLAEAMANRSDAIGFARRILESKRDVEKAKADNGFNASLTARLGFSNSALTIPKLYQHPQDQQLLQVEFDIPILDWGRSRSKLKTAQANEQFTTYAVQQDKQNFMQEINTQVTLFDMLKGQLQLTARADTIASEKYQIARDRYVLGNLNITDLSIAFQEKDQARRDYIYALRDLWATYYQLRYLSLYDFEKSQKINY